MIQVTSIVMSGVLDRFPTLRVAFLEAGASWIPFLIHRMDRSYAGRKHAEYVGGVIRTPSTYIKSGNLFFSAEPAEQSLPYLAETIGVETLLFTSDFPHEVNLAHCRAEIDAVLGRKDLSDDLQTKLLAENARRLYRLTD
jgi:predicted TIM-barrel fold metal-dependent hydrolase